MFLFSGLVRPTFIAFDSFFGGHVMLRFFLAIFLFSHAAMADIDESLRSQKAVVRYEFNETTGDTFVDSAATTFGAALNLSRKAGSVLRGIDGSGDRYIQIESASVIRSEAVASKLYNSCNKSTSTGLTVEAVVENAESVELRSAEFPMDAIQPLRLVSYSRKFANTNNVVNVNFALGQFYDMGNLYAGAATTQGNGNLFSDPIMTNTSVLRKSGKQTVIFTVSRGGVARIYLTDKYGNLFLAQETATGFGGDQNQFYSRWVNDAYLNVANDYIADADIAKTLSRQDNFAACTNSACNDNPNRYWKGKLFRLAVYCDALTREQVFGGAFQIIKNDVFPITNVTVTPSLLKASTIYERLTGVKTPIFNPLLQQMETLINANDAAGAARLITDPSSLMGSASPTIIAAANSASSSFYRSTVKDFGARMSNRDETINVPLNDFTATIIGAVRDKINAKLLLSDNFYYQADPSKAAVPSDELNDILKSNNHYEALERGGFDLKSVLIKKKQILVTGDGTAFTENVSPAGLLTTRQWAAAHMIAGTNRRAVEYSLRQFTCTPIESAADSTGPEDVVGRDVDRNPGGSMAKFTTSCRACHTVLDGFRPAFAYMTFSNGYLKHSALVPNSTQDNLNEDTSPAMRIHPAAPRVTRKMNHNEEAFVKGKIVTDDTWVNNANNGTNRNQFGWTMMSGTGVAQFGKALAESKAFPRCMAKRVFFSVCKREATPMEENLINQAAVEFSSPERNYDLRYLFERIVSSDLCLGGQ